MEKYVNAILFILSTAFFVTLTLCMAFFIFFPEGDCYADADEKVHVSRGDFDGSTDVAWRFKLWLIPNFFLHLLMCTGAV